MALAVSCRVCWRAGRTESVEGSILFGPQFDPSASHPLGPPGVLLYDRLAGEGRRATDLEEVERDHEVRLVYGRLPLGPRAKAVMLLVDVTRPPRGLPGFKHELPALRADFRPLRGRSRVRVVRAPCRSRVRCRLPPGSAPVALLRGGARVHGPAHGYQVEHTVPGSGDVDFVELFSVLRETGYDGALCVHLISERDRIESAAPRARERVEQLLRDAEPARAPDQETSTFAR